MICLEFRVIEKSVSIVDLMQNSNLFIRIFIALLNQYIGTRVKIKTRQISHVHACIT